MSKEDNNSYGIYYYSQCYYTSQVQVYLLAMCSTLEIAIKIVKEKYYNFNIHINNSIMCIDNDKNYCIIWINKYENDNIIKYNGLSCNQPNNSINIIDLLK